MNKNIKNLYLKQVERPIDGSPTVTLKNGHQCIPQHFYTFNHTLESVKTLLKRVSFSDKFNPYVFEENNLICLQIEIMGYENYHYSNDKREIKRVYGRKWRIEKNLPTSEIIQTVMLAMKKAIEHETRELFKLKSKKESFTTTPLNNHQDLPLLCKEHKILECDKNELTIKQVADLFSCLTFNNQSINLKSIKKHNSIFLVDFTFSEITKTTESNFFSWFHKLDSTIIVKNLCSTEILFGLMDELISICDRYVEENFMFDSVARFSRSLSPEKISRLAIQTRKKSNFNINSHTKKKIKLENFKVDLTRIPLSLRH